MITPAMKAAADYMRERFTYKADGWADKWVIGRMTGDCEDHALTTLWLLCGKSKSRTVKALLTGKARIIRTEAREGVGHAVLEWNGYYIDNIHKRWLSRFPYEKQRPYSRAMVALKLGFGGLF